MSSQEQLTKSELAMFFSESRYDFQSVYVPIFGIKSTLLTRPKALGANHPKYRNTVSLRG